MTTFEWGDVLFAVLESIYTISYWIVKVVWEVVVYHGEMAAFDLFIVYLLQAVWVKKIIVGGSWVVYLILTWVAAARSNSHERIFARKRKGRRRCGGPLFFDTFSTERTWWSNPRHDEVQAQWQVYPVIYFILWFVVIGWGVYADFENVGFSGLLINGFF